MADRQCKLLKNTLNGCSKHYGGALVQPEVDLGCGYQHGSEIILAKSHDLFPQVKIWFQNRRSKFKKLMKQGHQEKENPLLSSSNNNGNNNSASPASMTSPIMEPNSNGMDTNGSNGQAWSPSSAGDHSPQSQSTSGMSPTQHGMTSPHTVTSTPYDMMSPAQHVLGLPPPNAPDTPHHPGLKTELSSPIPTNGASSGHPMPHSGSVLPPFSIPVNTLASVSQADVPSSESGHDPYASVSIHHPNSMHGLHPLPHQQHGMMSSGFWYAGAEDSQPTVQGLQHNPQGLRTPFLK